jgi:large subunit ribosomal protein L18
MIVRIDRNKKRKKKHLSIRKKIRGTAERPRLSVYRSLSNIYAQIIDDDAGNTLVSASTLDPEFKEKAEYGGNKKAARLVGQILGKRAVEKGIRKVIFDRSGYIYHGRIKELAEGAREAGLEF